MSTTKHMSLGLLAVLAVVAAVSLMFIVPNYRQAAAVQAQIAELQARVETLGLRTAAVERLAGEVTAAREQAAADLKVVPETADVAGLIRKLSDAIDGVNVVDQTFTAGTPGPAIIGADASGSGAASVMSQPVSAEMRCTFESAQALIRKAEAMHRLVRIASVRLQCKRDDAKALTPLVNASVGLEVIYDSPVATPRMEGK